MMMMSQWVGVRAGLLAVFMGSFEVSFSAGAQLSARIVTEAHPPRATAKILDLDLELRGRVGHVVVALVGEDPQPRFPIHNLESHRAKEKRVNRLAIINGGNEERTVEAADQFPLERSRPGRPAIGPGIVDLPLPADGTTEGERPILLSVLDQGRRVHAIDDGVRPEAKEGRAILRQLLLHGRRGRRRLGGR